MKEPRSFWKGAWVVQKVTDERRIEESTSFPSVSKRAERRVSAILSRGILHSLLLSDLLLLWRSISTWTRQMIPSGNERAEGECGGAGRGRGGCKLSLSTMKRTIRA
jgi:hypothetical protein